MFLDLRGSYLPSDEREVGVHRNCRTFRGRRTLANLNSNISVGDKMFPFLSYHKNFPIPCHKHINKIRVDDQCVCVREKKRDKERHRERESAGVF